MSIVDIRVELAAHSHSFRVHVDLSATIRDVKHEITKSCPGAPRPEGQRVVCRGRFLQDVEKVEDIWKSPTDARVIHLAVHPSAWTTTPPTVPSSEPTSTATPVPPLSRLTPSTSSTQSARQHPSSIPQMSFALPSTSSAFGYVISKHQTAMNVLRTGTVTDAAAYQSPEAQYSRMSAIDALICRGYVWPSLLDEEYPLPNGNEEGVKYADITIQGRPYLSLTTPNAAPTPVQEHALKVLSMTFSILNIAMQDPIANLSMTAYPVSVPLAANTIDLNQRLQQLRLSGLLVPYQNPNPNDPNNAFVPAAPAAEIRAIPIRALVPPLTMLIIRTMLLLYFFSPSKRPLFGIMIVAWILYEAWGAIRAVLGNERENNRGRPAAADQPAAGRGDAAGQRANQEGQGGQAAGVRAPAHNGERNAGRNQINAVLGPLAGLNIAEEDAMLAADRPAPPPSTMHRVKTFVSLLFLTLYPAVWDRRRAMLRRREGRLRTEANVREEQPAPTDSEDTSASGEEDIVAREARLANESRERARVLLVAKHGRRPTWVKEYVERAVSGEWADDS